MPGEDHPPVCSYEGSDYQTSFWEKGGREYEDRCEAIALRHLLPPGGHLMLELGAGAGRNTTRYQGFEQVVLLDYSRTQLVQAQQRLGRSDNYIYVAADIYRLPFIDGLFDAATMIRALHHMADAPAALHQVRNVLRSRGIFILEFANKRNLKAILRYLLRRQDWNPFSPEPVEFTALNFDFHPRAIRAWLRGSDFEILDTRTVSHFRITLIKRLLPARLLANLDELLQWTGILWQVTPSVFIKAQAVERGEGSSPQPADIRKYFKCPACLHTPLITKASALACPACGRNWPMQDGIYDFREDAK